MLDLGGLDIQLSIQTCDVLSRYVLDSGFHQPLHRQCSSMVSNVGITLLSPRYAQFDRVPDVEHEWFSLSLGKETPASN